jgi:hypothetical protein
MKAMTMVLAAAAALLTPSMAVAQTQEACVKGYVSCMDVCVTKQSKSLQDGCITACQAKNDQCAEKIYGVRRVPGAPVQEAGQAKEALAKDAVPAPRQLRAPAPENAEAPPPRRLRPPMKAEAPAPRHHKDAAAEKSEAPAPRHQDAAAEKAEAPALPPIRRR